MDKPEKTAKIEPIRLGRNSKFNFKCHKDIQCFTHCCCDINVVLTPFDIIRLKNRLGLSSDEFLALYTEPQLLEKTDLPVVTLKFLEDQESGAGRKSCPFIRPDGCLVYADRPTTCRYYPLGVGTLSHKDEPDGDDFCFLVNEPHCLGLEEEQTWTVSEWREDQGVDLYDRINSHWTELLVRKRSFPSNLHLTEQAKRMFFLVSYNIDKFREFVFESSFLKHYEIDEASLAQIRTDEIALLQFGLKWLKWLLFKEGDFKNKSAADSQ